MDKRYLSIFVLFLISSMAFSQDMPDPPDLDDIDHAPDHSKDYDDLFHPVDDYLVPIDHDFKEEQDSDGSTSTGKLGLDTASGGAADTCASWTEPETVNMTDVMEQCEDGRCRECYTLIKKRYCIVFRGGEEMVDKGHTRTLREDMCTDWEPVCSYKTIKSQTRTQKDGDMCRECTDETKVLSCRDGDVLNDTKIETTCSEYYDCGNRQEADYKKVVQEPDEPAGFDAILAQYGLFIVIGTIVLIGLVVLFVVMNQKKLE